MPPEGITWDKTDAEWTAAAERGLLVGLSAWLDLAVQQAKKLAPFKTGRLEREIKRDPASPTLVGPLLVSGEFGVSGLEYAAAHEFGSGIHDFKNPHTYEIKPRYAAVLAFKWPNAPEGLRDPNNPDKTFFFRVVNHPGVRAANKGQGYLRGAAEMTRNPISGISGKTLMIDALKAELTRGV